MPAPWRLPLAARPPVYTEFLSQPMNGQLYGFGQPEPPSKEQVARRDREAALTRARIDAVAAPLGEIISLIEEIMDIADDVKLLNQPRIKDQIAKCPRLQEFLTDLGKLRERAAGLLIAASVVDGLGIYDQWRSGKSEVGAYWRNLAARVRKVVDRWGATATKLTGQGIFTGASDADAQVKLLTHGQSQAALKESASTGISLYMGLVLDSVTPKLEAMLPGIRVIKSKIDANRSTIDKIRSMPAGLARGLAANVAGAIAWQQFLASMECAGLESAAKVGYSVGKAAAEASMISSPQVARAPAALPPPVAMPAVRAPVSAGAAFLPPYVPSMMERGLPPVRAGEGNDKPKPKVTWGDLLKKGVAYLEPFKHALEEGDEAKKSKKMADVEIDNIHKIVKSGDRINCTKALGKLSAIFKLFQNAADHAKNAVMILEANASKIPDQALRDLLDVQIPQIVDALRAAEQYRDGLNYLIEKGEVIWYDGYPMLDETATGEFRAHASSLLNIRQTLTSALVQAQSMALPRGRFAYTDAQKKVRMSRWWDWSTAMNVSAEGDVKEQIDKFLLSVVGELGGKRTLARICASVAYIGGMFLFLTKSVKELYKEFAPKPVQKFFEPILPVSRAVPPPTAPTAYAPPAYAPPAYAPLPAVAPSQPPIAIMTPSISLPTRPYYSVAGMGTFLSV